MAFFTLDGGMHAYEREAGQVMVEENLVMPAFFIVAIFALLALFALMYVIFFVTVNTVALQLVFFNLPLVTV